MDGECSQLTCCCLHFIIHFTYNSEVSLVYHFIIFELKMLVSCYVFGILTNNAKIKVMEVMLFALRILDSGRVSLAGVGFGSSPRHIH